MKRYADAENLPTEHARLDDNGDGRGSELQECYLPPELGGRAGDESASRKSAPRTTAHWHRGLTIQCRLSAPSEQVDSTCELRSTGP